MKPYDVEQAREEVKDAERRSLDASNRAIDDAAQEAIRKIEVQARAFAELPRDLSSLFKDAAFIAIDEVDLRQRRLTSAECAYLYSIDLYFQGIGAVRVVQDRGTANGGFKIPVAKYRVLTFLLPID